MSAAPSRRRRHVRRSPDSPPALSLKARRVFEHRRLARLGRKIFKFEANESMLLNGLIDHGYLAEESSSDEDAVRRAIERAIFNALKNKK
jgi:hypothetical protein